MTEENPDKLPKYLLNDEDFVALIQQEMRDESQIKQEDALEKQRVWKKLERSLPAERDKYRTLKYGLVAAALLLGISPWIPGLFPTKEDQWKGGGSVSVLTASDLNVTQESGGARTLTLTAPSGAQGQVALMAGEEPFTVLWKGAISDQTLKIAVPNELRGRICAITARDEPLLEEKLRLIVDLKQFPQDAPCTSP